VIEAPNRPNLPTWPAVVLAVALTGNFGLAAWNLMGGRQWQIPVNLVAIVACLVVLWPWLAAGAVVRPHRRWSLLDEIRTELGKFEVEHAQRPARIVMHPADLRRLLVAVDRWHVVDYPFDNQHSARVFGIPVQVNPMVPAGLWCLIQPGPGFYIPLDMWDRLRGYPLNGLGVS
jgi:hypothetical protein